MTEQMLGELICEYTLQSTGSTTPQTARRGSCGTDQAPRPGRGFDLLRPEPRPLDRDDHGRLEARRPPDRITVRGKAKTEVKDDHLLPPLRYPPGQACLQPFSACAWEWRPVGAEDRQPDRAADLLADVEQAGGHPVSALRTLVSETRDIGTNTRPRPAAMISIGPSSPPA
jgi:hypothetical protein